MKTIKLPYKTSTDLTPILKQYSNVLRFSYNRFLENKTEKDIRLLAKPLGSTDLLNSWLIQCAIRDSAAIKKRFGDTKVIFGGKPNFANRAKSKLARDQFKLKRLNPLTSQGEAIKRGNRLFVLDIIENNTIVFKSNRNNHIIFELPNLKPNIKKDLFKLEQLNSNSKGYTYTVKFDLDFIYISFEEFKNETLNVFDSKRCLGIDLNPDAIGISVLEEGKVIHAQEFSLKKIFNKVFEKNRSSSDTKSKYFQNKLKFETIEISKCITSIAKQFKCQNVFIEDLSFKSPLNNNVSNRKNMNLWKRCLFVNNLKKRLNIESIELHLVNPAYSSFIGNLMYDYTDPVNASIEIARRGYEYRVKKNTKGFYPQFLVKQQWKQTVTKYGTWKDLFSELKNLKVKYRVSLDEVKHEFRVLQQSSVKSQVICYYFFITD